MQEEVDRPEVETKDETRLLNQYPVLRFFEYRHLSDRLQETSAPFCRMAWKLARTLPHDPETSKSLDKLLEAKDAAVRSEAVR